MKRWLGVLVAMALVFSSCGSDDGSAASNGSPDTAQGAGGADDGEGAADGASDGGSATASVEIGGTTYEFSGATDCFPSGVAGLAIRFEDGDDFVSLNQSGDVVLVRARFGGTEYVDNGTPAPPEVSGNRVTWSGELRSGGEGQAVEMSINC